MVTSERHLFWEFGWLGGLCGVRLCRRLVQSDNFFSPNLRLVILTYRRNAKNLSGFVHFPLMLSLFGLRDLLSDALQHLGDVFRRSAILEHEKSASILHVYSKCGGNYKRLLLCAVLSLSIDDGTLLASYQR